MNHLEKQMRAIGIFLSENDQEILLRSLRDFDAERRVPLDMNGNGHKNGQEDPK